MLKIFLVSILAMGGIGLFFGVFLSYTSKKFAVETGSAKKIEEVLPGANCGACGYPGCSAYAKAVAKGEASVSLCSVGGKETEQKIAEITGDTIEGEESKAKVAMVKCNGGKKCNDRFNYTGIQDCNAASLIHEGSKACSYGCLGLGSCVKVCPFGAIKINENDVAEVDQTICTGCEKCVAECPKNLIDMVPENATVHVLCKNQETGKPKCETGCIGCKLCERVCTNDAIKVENKVASIDYDLCNGCMACVKKCPVKAISKQSEKRKLSCYG